MAKSALSLGMVLVYGAGAFFLWDFSAGGSASRWLIDTATGTPGFSADPVGAVQKLVPPPTSTGLSPAGTAPAGSSEPGQTAPPKPVITYGTVIRPGGSAPESPATPGAPSLPDVPTTPAPLDVIQYPIAAFKQGATEAHVSPAVLFAIYETHAKYLGKRAVLVSETRDVQAIAQSVTAYAERLKKDMKKSWGEQSAPGYIELLTAPRNRDDTYTALWGALHSITIETRLSDGTTQLQTLHDLA